MIQSNSVQITSEVLSLIAGIDEFKGAGRALTTLVPARLSALRRVATIESIGSSTLIEGNKLSDREDYKTSTNSVVAFDEDGKQSGVVFETATPFDPPRLMTKLVTWFNDERSAARLHPLLLIGIWVVVFLEIHSFQDGNGRLNRVLTPLRLLQADYAHVPYSSLGSVIEQNREPYYLALRQTQATIRSESSNWQPWLVVFLHALADQVRRLNRKVEREKLVLAALPELSLQLVEFARERGRIVMGDPIRLTGSNRNTVKQHFRALVERGHLRQYGVGRGVWYG